MHGASVNHKTLNMSYPNFTFDSLPELIGEIFQMLHSMDQKIDSLQPQSQKAKEERWFNLKELCAYLPTHPSVQTVYGWTSSNLIPFHKQGKRITFLKSEIDEWLNADRRKSVEDLAKEAQAFFDSKKNPRF